MIERFHCIANEYDVVIVQDYAKGLLSQRLLDGIAKTAAESSLLLVGDPNPRNPLVWRGFNAVKPNLGEAFALSGVEVPDSSSEPLFDEAIRKVAQTLL